MSTAEIISAWNAAEEEFGYKSTEFLAAIVADRLGIEFEDVIDALAEAYEQD